MSTYTQTIIPATASTPAKVLTEDGRILDAMEAWRWAGNIPSAIVASNQPQPTVYF